MLLLAACFGGEESPAEQAKSVLGEALAALQRHDLEAYMQRADFSDNADSLQYVVILKALAQHQDRKEQQQGTVVRTEMVDARMLGDTVCTVFYQLVYADSTVELSSQKMIKRGKDWKLRLRN